MELNEVLRRIGAQHWRLLLICVLLGVGLAAVIQHGRVSSYTASTRVVLDTQDPKSRPESAAIADTARGIATSPSEVARALRQVHATDRDPGSFAKKNVALEALGSSGVLQLSVRDRDPRVASGIANALADQVLRTRLGFSSGQAQQVLDVLEKQINATTEQVATADSRIERLAVKIAGARGAARANALRAQRNDAARLRDVLAQRTTTLESERVSILSAGAVRPKASVISAATPPSHRDASGTATTLVLGLMLGLVVGLGAAGVLEVVQPTLVGGDAIAIEFDTPLLGSLPAEPHTEQPAHALGATATLVRLAAERAGLASAGLLPVGRPAQVDRLADALHGELADASGAPNALSQRQYVPFYLGGAAAGEESTVSEHAPTARRRPRLRIGPFIPRAIPALSNGDSPGLVLVSPDTIKKGDLDEARRLLAVSALPVLGLITYRIARPPGWLGRWPGRTAVRQAMSGMVTTARVVPEAASPEERADPVAEHAEAGGRS